MYDLAKHIPKHMRPAVAAGEAPAYRLNKPDYDRLPLDTFLVEAMMGTGGRCPLTMARIVRPNDPTKYQREKLTPAKRLLYISWVARTDGKSWAVKQLLDAKVGIYRHVVLPDDPRFPLMVAFKLACDMKRAMSAGRVEFPGDLLIRALGIEPLDPNVAYNFTENAR